MSEQHCERAGCSRPIKARGLCQMHYDRDRSRAGRRREGRVLATRARNRAAAALIKAHPDEFAKLLTEAQRAVGDEYQRIVEAARELGVEPTTDGQIFRLKRGPVADDETAADRLQLTNPTTCSCCSRVHEHDHACPECGTTLGMPVERDWSPRHVKEHADDLIKASAKETAAVIASYDEFDIGDRYRVRVPPRDWEWDDEVTA